MTEENVKQIALPLEDDSGAKHKDLAAVSAESHPIAGYALYYPLVSEWEHPDGIRFDQPRD